MACHLFAMSSRKLSADTIRKEEFHYVSSPPLRIQRLHSWVGDFHRSRSPSTHLKVHKLQQHLLVCTTKAAVNKVSAEEKERHAYDIYLISPMNGREENSTRLCVHRRCNINQWEGGQRWRAERSWIERNAIVVDETESFTDPIALNDRQSSEEPFIANCNQDKCHRPSDRETKRGRSHFP